MIFSKKLIAGGLVAFSMVLTGCLTDDPAPVPAGTPLSAAMNFTFQRNAGVDTTGLAAYGLGWSSSVIVGTALTAVISKSTATKLVVLTAAAWTSDTTKESVKLAIDNAAGVTDYRGVDFDTPPNAYDNVIGVINGTTYYILHITGTNDVADPVITANRIRTITGQSKY